MTALRQRYIEDLQLRGLSPRTQESYVRVVRKLAEHYGKSPDVLTEEELRQYLLYLKNEKHAARNTCTLALCSLKFFYQQTLKRDWPVLDFVRPARDRKLPVVFSVEEVQQILGCVRRARYRVCLSLIYACGLRLLEGVRLPVADVDGARMVIHVRHGKGGQDRYVPLPRRTLELLREYWSCHRDPVWMFPSVTAGGGPMCATGVQRAIDRIIFLRMAEDRGIEDYGRLQRLTTGDNLYAEMIKLFRHADARYNSGLFDFSAKGDRLTPVLKLDDKALMAILADLYFPQSPYQFSVLPVEILGNVYEQFLGKVIRLTPAHQAKVEEKPEVKKAGGVYYTPAYIVDYIVTQTVGAAVEGKTPAQLTGFRVLDPACGSGSFLLGAYQYLLDHYKQWYTANNPERHKQAVYRTNDGADWRLTSAEKKRILTEHIFGVDIDRQAVEVTKLSLLLTVLENESGVTLAQQLTLLPEEARERALPNLDQNIKCGNSLIGPDYFSVRLLPDAEELARVNAFDWKVAFPEAMAAGGFSAVIGNPPYIRTQTLKEWAPLEVEAYKELYRSARSGNYDIYVVFVEKGLSLLNKTGRLGFILPHKFLKAEYGRPLRAILAEGRLVSQIVHVGDQQVFDGATTYTCLLFLDRKGAESFTLTRVPDVRQLARGPILAGDTFSAAAINEGARDLEQENRTSIWQQRECRRLEEMAHVYQGIATSADSVYVLEVVQKGPRVTLVRSRELGEQVRIETASLLHLLKGSEIRRYEIADPFNALLFPYNLEAGQPVLLSRRDLESRFPLALEYLERCKAKLLKRSKVDPRVYWHYPYPKNLVMYQQPKLLVQVLSTRGAFAADLEGKFCFLGGGTAGGNAIHLRDGRVDQYLNLLGILNSRYTTHYVRRVGSEFRGGYRSFGKGSIGGLPVPITDLTDPADRARHDRMTALVERMLELHRRRKAAGSDHEGEHLQRQIDATDGEIDALVYELYRLTAEEIATIEAPIL